MGNGDGRKTEQMTSPIVDGVFNCAVQCLYYFVGGMGEIGGLDKDLLWDIDLNSLLVVVVCCTGTDDTTACRQDRIVR